MEIVSLASNFLSIPHRGPLQRTAAWEPTMSGWALRTQEMTRQSGGRGWATGIKAEFGGGACSAAFLTHPLSQ